MDIKDVMRKGKAVLLNTGSYENKNKVIAILKIISSGEKDVSDGKLTDQDTFFNSLEKKI